MPKRIKVSNYQNAYDIIYGEWISIHPCDHYDKETKEGPLFSSRPMIDDQIIRREEFETLSKEAKEMVRTILFSPSEILHLITTPKTGKITIRGIKNYFAKKWRSQFIADVTVEEIKTWVSKL